MKATSLQYIQSFWGGSGLSKGHLTANLWKLLQEKLPLRSTRATCVIDIQSDSNFARHVLKKIALERVTNPATSHVDLFITEKFISDLTRSGSYLLSQVVHDIEKLRKVDWTVELDPFWQDQSVNHRKLHNMLYVKNSEVSKTRESEIIDFILKYFEDMVRSAFRTEATYSRIFYAKFHMQRGVRDPIKREKILLGCAESFNEFKETVPAEYSKKAIAELQWQLMAIRHWVWDCPNAKRIYSRILA